MKISKPPSEFEWYSYQKQSGGGPFHSSQRAQTNLEIRKKEKTKIETALLHRKQKRDREQQEIAFLKTSKQLHQLG